VPALRARDFKRVLNIQYVILSFKYSRDRTGQKQDRHGSPPTLFSCYHCHFRHPVAIALQRDDPRRVNPAQSPDTTTAANMTETATRYLNRDALAAIKPGDFQSSEPYPWVNPQGFLTDQGYRELLDTMPDIARFRAFFGKQRKHGQASHDRYVLDYEDGMSLARPWQDFIDELKSDVYRRFICGLLGVSTVRFRFHWHYTPDGGEVSPHCDSKGKIGSQIFYMNTAEDWQPGWGGETIVLDDGGRISPDNNPAFEDFIAAYPAETIDNHSLLFGRRGNSWHGVKRIHCPEGAYRKVFIVVFEEHRPLKMAGKRVKRLLSGKPLTTHKESLMY
jgi:hypothetical protein